MTNKLIRSFSYKEHLSRLCRTIQGGLLASELVGYSFGDEKTTRLTTLNILATLIKEDMRDDSLDEFLRACHVLYEAKPRVKHLIHSIRKGALEQAGKADLAKSIEAAHNLL